MKTNSTKAFFLFALFLCYSCKYDHLEDTMNPDCNALLPDSVSFSKNVIPIFEQNCSISGCHTGTAPAANLNLSSSVAYATLSKKGSGYIDTINPQASVLYSTLNSNAVPMPPTGKLDDCTLALIAKWMQQKARNN